MERACSTWSPQESSGIITMTWMWPNARPFSGVHKSSQVLGSRRQLPWCTDPAFSVSWRTSSRILTMPVYCTQKSVLLNSVSGGKCCYNRSLNWNESKLRLQGMVQKTQNHTVAQASQIWEGGFKGWLQFSLQWSMLKFSISSATLGWFTQGPGLQMAIYSSLSTSGCAKDKKDGCGQKASAEINCTFFTI